MRTRLGLGLGLGLGLALAVGLGSADVDAQLRGLLKKKAAEIAGKKAPDEKAAEKKEADEKAPDEKAPEAAAADTATPPATAAPAAGARTAASPLEISELDLPRKAHAILRNDVGVKESGEWSSLPYVPELAVAAARALGETAQVTLVDTVGAAFKALVMSDAFAAEHAAWVKTAHQGVDHGLTGLVSTEALLKSGDPKAMEARFARDGVVATVDMVLTSNQVTEMFDYDAAEWARSAAQTSRSNRATYQKLAADAQALKPLATSDLEKFRRGYATLKVAESGGPATEDAVFALYARGKQEAEQMAWDAHSLRGQLKRHLATFVAVAPTVDFGAATEQKNGKTRFVNPAYEAKGAIWKACFRAGKAPTDAALQLARAWAKEL